jgi:hypothetical protein
MLQILIMNDFSIYITYREKWFIQMEKMFQIT